MLQAKGYPYISYDDENGEHREYGEGNINNVYIYPRKTINGHLEEGNSGSGQVFVYPVYLSGTVSSGTVTLSWSGNTEARVDNIDIFDEYGNCIAERVQTGSYSFPAAPGAHTYHAVGYETGDYVGWEGGRAMRGISRDVTIIVD